MQFFLHTPSLVRLLYGPLEYRCTPDEFQTLEPDYPGLPEGVIMRYQTPELTFLDTGAERQEDTVDALQYCANIATYPSSSLASGIASPFFFPFIFAGPIWTGQMQHIGFKAALEIQRAVIFVENIGTTGDNLVVDLRINSNSILDPLPSIAPGTGATVCQAIPETDFDQIAIPSDGILSAHLLSTPDDAQGITVNVWLSP